MNKQNYSVIQEEQIKIQEWGRWRFFFLTHTSHWIFTCFIYCFIYTLFSTNRDKFQWGRKLSLLIHYMQCRSRPHAQLSLEHHKRGSTSWPTPCSLARKLSCRVKNWEIQSGTTNFTCSRDLVENIFSSNSCKLCSVKYTLVNCCSWMLCI